MKNLNAKISIVVPIYNGENYIRQCLNSLLGQTYSDIEILCVDDGSTDQTARILSDYRKKDGRIIVLTQENKGVVSARYNGVLHALGDYLTFVDSDDYVDSHLIEHMLSQIEDCDMVTVGAQMETGTNYMTMHDAIEEGRYMLSQESDYFWNNLIRYKGDDIEGILQFCWGKMYRTDLLKKIYEKLDFSIRYAEDRELIYTYILQANSIRISHRLLYFYRDNVNSVMHRANEFVLEDLGRVYRILRKKFESHSRKDALLSQLEQMVTSRMYVLSKYMGFNPVNQTVRYIMPYFEGINNKKLVLYGAGVVGCNFYRQTKDNPDINWVLWVDKTPSNSYVVGLDELDECAFDYIVIGVLKKRLYEEIKSELKERGIPSNRILWKVPISLAE